MVSAALLAGQPVCAALRAVQAALAAAGCPDAGFDARELCRLAAVCRTDPRLDNTSLTAAQAEKLADLTARRAAREPLQYLVGEWDFLDFTLAVGPGVLCPRADSEVVCETAVGLLKKDPRPNPLVYDLCAGTGCLGLGIKRFVPDAVVVCVEKSAAALVYLRKNAAALPGFTAAAPAATAVQADIADYWRQIPPGSAALIISNPPYLSAAEMTRLMPETAREPALALDGGADGLDFYRLLLRHYRAALCPGGALVLEIGCTQAAAVLALGAQFGWQNGACRRDYGGNDRVICFKAP